MPGVADSIRRTNLVKEKESRRKDMEDLLLMVRENRLHEADERQLENLRLALELKNFLGEKNTVSASDIERTITQAINSALQNISFTSSGQPSPAIDSGSRPSMKHVSLSEINQSEERVEIQNVEAQETTSEKDDAVSKLAKLRKLKGNNG